MFKKTPDLYPLDEIEEDMRRKETGIFTASCKEETAAERLKTGFATLKLWKRVEAVLVASLKSFS